MREVFMFGKRFVFAPLLLTLVAAQAGLSTGARAEQPTFVWQEGRQFDGRTQHVVVPHDPKWLLDQGAVVLDFTADRLKGIQGLISKDANGKLDGGHLVIWLDEGTVVARLQDQKSDYIAQSPAKTVKKGMPTRLALAFGSGGMKLYVGGKMVASNAYQGGLRGNQEPLVIGARDWRSSPRAADNLEAFFAGTIGALALYGQPLDGPAIAALGPAGTALAQIAGPGTGGQQPATAEVAVGMPTQPSQAPVELKMPPASVSPGVQQPVTVQPTITENVTITATPVPVEDLQTQILRAQQSQQPLQVRSGTAGLALQPWRDEVPAVAMFWQRAKLAAASNDMDEQRAALFVELVKAAFKPQKSDQELRGLEWWARIMKLKRIQAAEGAKQTYADWQNNTTGARASRIDVMLGNDKVNPPGLDVLLESGFERVSGPATDAANKSWETVRRRLKAAQVELQNTQSGGTDVLAIIDGVVQTLSMMEGGFTIWTAAAGSAYSIASTRWRQIQEAQGRPGELEGFLSFAKATTPSLTENLYTEDGAKFAYVALIETTL
jgi:hypothetical protein